MGNNAIEVCNVIITVSLYQPASRKKVSVAEGENNRLGHFYILYHAGTFELHLLKLNPYVHVSNRLAYAHFRQF